MSFYKFLPPYMHAPNMSIEAFCEGVFGGLSHSGGVWAHVCGWWARRRDANVCWVCYETLREHPEREIARIARFMGVPDDAATVAGLHLQSSPPVMRGQPSPGVPAQMVMRSRVGPLQFDAEVALICVGVMCER